MSRNTSSLNPVERSASLVLSLSVPAVFALVVLSVSVGGGGRQTPRETLVSYSIEAETRDPPEEKPRREVRRTPRTERQRSAQADPKPVMSEQPQMRPLPISLVDEARPLPRTFDLERPSSAPATVSSTSAGHSPGREAASGATGSLSSAERAGGQARGGQSDRYGQLVYRRVRSEQRFETVLRREELPGTVAIAFTVDRRGRLRNVHVSVSSGSVTLDRVGLRHLAHAAPFPPPPRGRPRSFVMPLTYRQSE